MEGLDRQVRDEVREEAVVVDDTRPVGVLMLDAFQADCTLAAVLEDRCDRL